MSRSGATCQSLCRRCGSVVLLAGGRCLKGASTRGQVPQTRPRACHRAVRAVRIVGVGIAVEDFLILANANGFFPCPFPGRTCNNGQSLLWLLLPRPARFHISTGLAVLSFYFPSFVSLSQAGFLVVLPHLAIGVENRVWPTWSCGLRPVISCAQDGSDNRTEP